MCQRREVEPARDRHVSGVRPMSRWLLSATWRKVSGATHRAAFSRSSALPSSLTSSSTSTMRLKSESGARKTSCVSGTCRRSCVGTNSQLRPLSGCEGRRSSRGIEEGGREGGSDGSTIERATRHSCTVRAVLQTARWTEQAERVEELREREPSEAETSEFVDDVGNR